MGKKDMEAIQAKIAEGEANEAKKKRKERKEKLKKQKSNFFADFKKFITRGNVIDMAVAVIVGGAFTAIVNAISNQVLKPLINALMALIFKKDSLSELFTFLKKVEKEEAIKQVVDGTEVIVGYKTVPDLTNSIYIDWGTVINAVINFLMVALLLFIIARIATRVWKRIKARELAAAKEEEEKKKAEEKVKADAAAAATAAAAAEKEAQLQAFYANIARQTELLEQLSKKQ
ncbi:MAG: MscL family protein [Ruminococcaceae bacterium]|nr:MscL family protein [Oscillospiraceae bacterium]